MKKNNAVCLVFDEEDKVTTILPMAMPIKASKPLVIDDAKFLASIGYTLVDLYGKHLTREEYDKRKAEDEKTTYR